MEDGPVRRGSGMTGRFRADVEHTERIGVVRRRTLPGALRGSPSASWRRTRIEPTLRRDIAHPPPTGLPRSRPLHHSPPRARHLGAEPDPSRRRDGGPTRAAGGPGGAKPQGTLASTHSGGQPNARGRVHSGGWACGFSVRFSPPVGWAVENNTAVFPHVCAQLWMNHIIVLPQIHSSELTCG